MQPKKKKKKKKKIDYTNFEGEMENPAPVDLPADNFNQVDPPKPFSKSLEPIPESSANQNRSDSPSKSFALKPPVNQPKMKGSFGLAMDAKQEKI